MSGLGVLTSPSRLLGVARRLSKDDSHSPAVHSGENVSQSSNSFSLLLCTQVCTVNYTPPTSRTCVFSPCLFFGFFQTCLVFRFFPMAWCVINRTPPPSFCQFFPFIFIHCRFILCLESFLFAALCLDVF